MRRLHYTLLRLVSAVDRSVRERLTGAGKLAAISAFMAAIVGLDTHQSLASQVFALLAAMLVVIFGPLHRWLRERIRGPEYLAQLGADLVHDLEVLGVQMPERGRAEGAQDALGDGTGT